MARDMFRQMDDLACIGGFDDGPDTLSAGIQARYGYKAHLGQHSPGGASLVVASLRRNRYYSQFGHVWLAAGDPCAVSRISENGNGI